MADAADLKSVARKGRVGSSPALGTTFCRYSANQHPRLSQPSDQEAAGPPTPRQTEVRRTPKVWGDVGVGVQGASEGASGRFHVSSATRHR